MSGHTITFTRVKHDVNGNPRYVCHFLNLVPDLSNDKYGVSERYAIACKRANSIGGRKYHTKGYGGGIVFSSYSLDGLCRHIAGVTGVPVEGYTVD